MKQLGIGIIRQSITSRTNRRASIQIAVGKRLVRRTKTDQRGAKKIHRLVKAPNVLLFGVLIRDLDRHQLQWTYFGQDKDKSGERVSPNARLLAVLIPIVLSGHSCHL